jgi:dihydrofolate synthase/folylpolyglutamate synthase
MHTYREALDILNRFVNYERSQPSIYSPETLNLDRVNLLLDRLGRPDRQFRAIHIAGTKGKGSTAAMIESVLRTAGYHTGLYTSPHLHTFRERMRVNNELISKENFAATFNSIEPHVNAIEGITWFEIVTALAFTYFAQSKIDVGVIEVGLGGRFDATNVLRPIVSVITSLSMDHMKLLGNTIEQIAFEKAGIIKPKIPVVSSPQRPEALAVIEKTAKDRNAPLIVVGKDVIFEMRASSIGGQEFIYQPQAGASLSATLLGQAAPAAELTLHREHRYTIPLLGAHQISNAATAIASLMVAEQQGLSITDETIVSGLANVKWPGRLEILNRDPLLVVDGAHNSDSAQKLAQSLRDIFGDRAWTLIVGISADKDIPAILDELIPIASRVIVTRAHNVRAADLEALAEKVTQYNMQPSIANTVHEAIDLALNDHNAIIITGSLFTVADAREAWFDRSGLSLPEKDE